MSLRKTISETRALEKIVPRARGSPVESVGSSKTLVGTPVKDKLQDEVKYPEVQHGGQRGLQQGSVQHDDLDRTEDGAFRVAYEAGKPLILQSTQQGTPRVCYKQSLFEEIKTPSVNLTEKVVDKGELPEMPFRGPLDSVQQIDYYCWKVGVIFTRKMSFVQPPLNSLLRTIRPFGFKKLLSEEFYYLRKKVMEVGTQAESEQIFQKIKTLVKKKKLVNIFHCHSGPDLCISALQGNSAILFLSRKSINCIPLFLTYQEAKAEFSKYIYICTLNAREYEISFKKQIKILRNQVDVALSEPELSSEEFPQNLVTQCRKYCQIKDLILPYDTFFMTSLNFYESYQRTSRKLLKDCRELVENNPNNFKILCTEERNLKNYTLKTIICSPLHTMNEDLANTFYNIRLKKLIKEMDVAGEVEQPTLTPLKSNLMNHLSGILRKMNWCLNHLESDIDIEIAPSPGIAGILNTPLEEISLKKDLIDTMEKKLELWGRYIKNLLNKCRSKEPKGSGPVAEYLYWFRREDHIGPLLLTLNGPNVSSIVNILQTLHSSEVKVFIERRVSLKKYYEIARDNRDYISVSIQCLEGINNAKDLDEVQKIIPEFWKNLRFLWLLSGYWAVKSNIVGFVERVQNLIVKKSIKVLEVNHFFMIPQRIAKQLAMDVIKTMGCWKSTFYTEKSLIEGNQWEMRWEFPSHRMFSITDYMAKLARDFSYLSHNLKQYLDIFSIDFSKVVKEEKVIEGFSQRVKSLTVPLRTADFNIYDPDNDVHWNLLIETFTRELGLIELESLHIINQSFNNLKSSVNATNLLLSYKETKPEDKSFALLFKKFEYVNIQIIKEMKLISEFIMNQVSDVPILYCHSRNSGLIHWLRHLCTSFLYRYMYLENICEINSTRTQRNAKSCFKSFMKFYDLYQLAVYTDWINTETRNIDNQLSRRIFKLRNISSPFINENYNDFVMRPRRIKILARVKDDGNYEQDNKLNIFENSIKRKNGFEKDKKVRIKIKYMNHNVDMYENYNVTVNRSIDKDVLEPAEEIKSLRRILVHYFFEERRVINNITDVLYDNKTLLFEEKTVEFGEYPNVITQDLRECTRQSEVANVENTTQEHDDDSKSNLKSNLCIHSDNLKYKKDKSLFERTHLANEIFLSLIKSQSSQRSHEIILKDIQNVMEGILIHYSKLKGSQMKATFSDSLSAHFHLPLFMCSAPSLINFPSYHGPFEYVSSVLPVTDPTQSSDSIDYSILNKGRLFEASPIHQKPLSLKTFKDDTSLYELLLRNPTGFRSIAFQEFTGTKDKNKSSLVKESSNRFKDILKKKNELQLNRSTSDSSSSASHSSICLNKKSDVPWHEYISDNLLIEKSHMVDLNFDIKLFDVIIEVYQMIKLGYQLPEELYGLGLLNRSLLSDLKNLKNVIEKYDNIILNLTKETLVLLKTYLRQFEYFLMKGLNYYSWHTTKIEKFYITLHSKMENIVSLNNDVQNTIICIYRNIENIKSLDWFDFNGLPLSMGIKTFFDELEKRRDASFEKLIKLCDSLSPQLKRLEFLVFKEFSGTNSYMVLFYKHYEECILKAIVSNFLLNIKKFRNFIVGAEDQKVQLTLIHTFDIEFNFNTDQCTFFFINAIENLLRRYKMLGRWMQGTCLPVHWIRSSGVNRLYKYNYLEDIIKLKPVATELINIKNLIHTVTKNLSSFYERWKNYRVLWNFDKEITADNYFKEISSIVEKCDTVFCYYDVFIKEFESCKNHVDIFCIRVDLAAVRNEILTHAFQWKNTLKCKLTDLSRTHFSRLHSTIMEIHGILRNGVYSLDDFQNVLQSIKDFDKFSSECGASMSYITKIQYIIARHGLKYSNADRRILKEVQSFYSEAQILVTYRSSLVKPSFEIYKRMSQDLKIGFEKECLMFAETYYKEGPGTVGKSLDIGYTLLQTYKNDFKELNVRRKKMICAEILFEHLPNSYDFFDESFHEFSLLEVVYELYQRQKESREQWAQIPWIYLNDSHLTDGIKGFLWEFHDLDHKIQELPVAQEIKKCLTNFKNSIPIMVELKNESLKERHWRELMDKTGYNFDMVPSKFILNDLFSMNLYLHRETVDDIIGKATRELNIEKSVNNMKKFWSSQQLKCTQESSPILENTTVLLVLLDDYGIDLGRVAESQFALPFLGDIKEWEKTLSDVREIIFEWEKLQEGVINLRKVFKDRNLQKTFPKPYELYQSLDNEFSKLVKSIQYKTNIFEQTLASDLLERIITFQISVEECQGLLAKHLALKRNTYPRFYLLLDEELLSIMGSTFPDNMELLISKVFMNIQAMLIKEMNSIDEDYEIRGLISSEHEILSFQNAVQTTEDVTEWMKSLQDEMKYSTKYITKMSIYNYATVTEPRIKWIEAHMNSAILASIRVWWTAEVEDIFSKIKKGELQSMKTYLGSLNSQLNDSFQTVKGNLEKLQRMRLINVILIDLHGRDVIEKFANNSVMESTDFEWESQIKFYWKKSTDTLIINQCLGNFEYGYEYSGVGRQLVTTPLTQRVYLALTQAIFNMYPSALTGLPSAGKTETVKGLATVFGIFCVFTNCSEFLSIAAVRNTLFAVCHDGIWACFDEFNLIKPSTLSVIGKQINTIQEAAIRNLNTIFIDGKELSLKGRLGLYITMNPGFFSSSSDFPQTLRLLFRPVSCSLPNLQHISYAMLFSEGFSQAQILSKKIAKLFELANVQLSKQGRYDFGLRTLKPLLEKAGELKRNAPDIAENVVIMRAIRDSNRSKFISGDEVIFAELRQAIFSVIDCPPIVFLDFEKAVENVWARMNYVYVRKLGMKVVELYEVLLERQSGAVVGPSGGGKSVVINTLSQALTDIQKPTTLIRLNPKAIPISELFGYFDSNKYWVDGLFSKIFREINRADDNKKKYIVCDGDMDEHWLENINSVMDCSKQLTIANCERIPLLENCGIIFETGHIRNVSPGTISRMGIVYMDQANLGYKTYWERWITSRIDEEEMKMLNNLFHKYVPKTLELILDGRTADNTHYPPLKTVIPQTKLNLVVQLCFMIDVMYPIVEKDHQIPLKVFVSNEAAINKNKEEAILLESIFIQAMYASLGASLTHGGIEIFDSFIKTHSKLPHFDDSKDKKADFGFIPTCGNTLFDYYADKDKNSWIPWSDLVNQYIHNTSKTFDEIIVPTTDSCRIIWLMKLVNKFNCTDLKFKSFKYKMRARKKIVRPFIIIGPKSSTKTTILREFWKNLNLEMFNKLNILLSSKTKSNEIEIKIQTGLTQYSPFMMVPTLGKKLIIFIDDLHMPQVDDFGTQQTTQYLKLLVENCGMFQNGSNIKWKTIRDVYYYATLTLRGSSVETIDPRFLSLFSICSVYSPSESTISQIYSAILKGHTSLFNEDIKSVCCNIIQGTLIIYKFVTSMLLPIPSKFHYTFNIRDFSRIFEGLTQVSPGFCQSVQQFVRVWRNETTRVFCDRLVSSEDRELLENEMKATIRQLFPSCGVYALRDPLLFGDYRNAMQKGFPRDYEDLLDYEAVYHLFTEILEDVKKNCPNLNLVLFEDVLDHLTRVHRILRMWRGHVLVVGPIGSGKRTIVKLASYTAGCQLFQIMLTKNYGTSEFISDMKKLFTNICLKNKQTSFMITSHQILSEDILGILNTLLMTGSFTSILSEDEKSAIMNEHFFDFYDKLKDDKSLFWDELDKNCGRNFHLAFLMSELNQRSCQRFPALLDNTTIDWILPWPSQALSAIARRHLKDIDNIPDRLKDPVVTIIVEIYESTVGFTAKESTFPSYITPRHYINFIELYKRMIENRHENHIIQNMNLEKAINKVNESTAMIEEMKINIQKQKMFVDEKKDLCKLVSKDILDAVERFNIEKKSLSEKCQEVEALNQEMNQEMQEIKKVLSKAMGDIEKAQEAVRDLDMEDITNLSLLEYPTEITSIAFESVLVLLGETVINWEEVKKMLTDPLFLNKLEEININTITLLQQKHVRARLKRIEKLKDPNAGLAEKAFLSLVDAILSYCAAFRETKPKQEKITDLEKELNKEQNEQNGIQVKLAQIEEELKQLKIKELKTTSDSEEAEEDLKLTLQKLEAANRLITGLSFDNNRWQNKVGDLQKEKSIILGNSLVCSGFLSYCGTFTWSGRKQLFSIWTQNIRQKRIPITMPFQLETELVDDILLSKLRSECLPNNEWSIQNALLTMTSKKYPLCVDPKGQAVNWIIRKERDNNLTVLSYEEKSFFENYKNCIQDGNPILIKDIEYLNPIILEKIYSEIEGMFNKERKVVLYMTTVKENPNFDPYIFSETCVINFSITREELEEHLLHVLLQNKENDLWNTLEKTNEQIYLNKLQIDNLTKSLLEKLVKLDCSILESTERIKDLYITKLEIEEIQQKLLEEESLLSDLEAQRSIYRPLAKCGATLFFILSNQSSLNNFNEISMSLFVHIFLYSLKNFSINSKDENQINIAILHLQHYFHHYCCRGAFSSQKLLVSLQMAIEFEKSEGNLTDNDVKFFIIGGTENQDVLSPFKWLSTKDWSGIQQLNKDFPNDFMNIIEHMTSNKSEWEEWYEIKGPNKLWFPLSNELKPFHKLMLMRCLCTDLLTSYVENYVNEIMQNPFKNQSHIRRNEIFEESSSKIPVIFISTAGSNPMEYFLEIANFYKMAYTYDNYALGEENDFKLDRKVLISWMINCGKTVNVFCLTRPTLFYPSLQHICYIDGRRVRAIQILEEALRSGRWAVYNNCHMGETFLNKAMEILQSRQSIHENFRLWLIAEPNPKLPSSILQISIKEVIDSPNDFKSKLRQNYEDMENYLSDSCDHPCFKRLVFATTLFHSVLQERRKYGRIGLNLEYAFGQPEFYLSLKTITEHLRNSIKNGLQGVPWKCIKYLIGEIIYGGYVLDEYDRRVITTYLDEYYDEFILSVDNIFTFYCDETPKSESLPKANKEDYISEIDQIVMKNSSNILGLNNNNELYYNKKVSNKLWEQLARMQGYPGPKSISKKENDVNVILQKLSEIIPECFNINKIKDIHKEKKNIEPIIFVLLHEVELFNQLIERIVSTILDLRNALDGKTDQEEWMKKMYDELYMDKVPSEWRKQCPETSKTLTNWMTDLIIRAQQYTKWANQGQISVMWLGGLHLPKSYLISHMQIAAKKNGWEIENLIFKTCITDLYNPDNVNTQLHDIGCHISGVYLEGAKWDSQKHCLIPEDTRVLINPLPILYILPAEKFLLILKENLKIPVYKTPLRNSSMNGLVFEAEINTSVHISKWILQGVAMILNTN